VDGVLCGGDMPLLFACLGDAVRYCIDHLCVGSLLSQLWWIDPRYCMLGFVVNKVARDIMFCFRENMRSIRSFMTHFIWFSLAKLPNGCDTTSSIPKNMVLPFFFLANLTLYISNNIISILFRYLHILSAYSILQD
jgi:hypothetical protein